ncbi:uncharacterized protein [Henckelia pumila]|uniref:uncharacterized protein n=1 Tax=Henckelia pumila TaxID=405737 RepID=UPI003C6E4609
MAQTTVWWDMENCGIPKRTKALHLSKNINIALEQMNYSGSIVSIYGYGDTKHVNQNDQQALSNTGVRLIHIPGGTKDSSDKKMIVDMSLWADNHEPPANMMIITGDGDFTDTLNNLKSRGYNVLLGLPEVYSSSFHLKFCSAMWKWTRLAEGRPPFVSNDIILRNVRARGKLQWREKGESSKGRE